MDTENTPKIYSCTSCDSTEPIVSYKCRCGNLNKCRDCKRRDVAYMPLMMSRDPITWSKKKPHCNKCGEEIMFNYNYSYIEDRGQLIQKSHEGLIRKDDRQHLNELYENISDIQNHLDKLLKEKFDAEGNLEKLYQKIYNVRNDLDEAQKRIPEQVKRIKTREQYLQTMKEAYLENKKNNYQIAKQVTEGILIKNGWNVSGCKCKFADDDTRYLLKPWMKGKYLYCSSCKSQIEIKSDIYRFCNDIICYHCAMKTLGVLGPVIICECDTESFRQLDVGTLVTGIPRVGGYYYLPDDIKYLFTQLETLIRNLRNE